MSSRILSGLSMVWLVALAGGCADVIRPEGAPEERGDGEAVDATSSPAASTADVGAGGDSAQGSGAGGSGGAPASECPGGIRWLDDAPLERGRTRYVEPGLTGDGEGFLLVTTERVPDRCEGVPCVRVEHLPPSGGGSAVHVPFEPDSERIRIFTGTDAAWRGHFAVAAESDDPAAPSGVSTIEDVSWGAGIAGAEAPTRWTLDSTRGLGAVAFDVDGTWLVTHDWEPEGSVGEGFSYPIEPSIERVANDGTSTAVPGIDPTNGTWFIEPRLVASTEGPWLATRTFPSGPLRIAGPGWTGDLGDGSLYRPFAVVALPGGAVVAAHLDENAVRLVRLEADGTTSAVASLPASPDATELALATDGTHIIVAHRASEALQVSLLEASLESAASTAIPDSESVGRWSVVRVAAASNGTYAVLVSPFPSGDDEVLPVQVRRFKACEPPR